MLQSKKIINFWFPVIFWAALIFLLSSLPTKPVSEVYIKDFVIKKSAHIVEYGIFAVFLYRAFKLSGVEKTRAGLYSIIISLFLFTVSDSSIINLLRSFLNAITSVPLTLSIIRFPQFSTIEFVLGAI